MSAGFAALFLFMVLWAFGTVAFPFSEPVTRLVYPEPLQTLIVDYGFYFIAMWSMGLVLIRGNVIGMLIDGWIHRDRTISRSEPWQPEPETGEKTK